MRAYDLTEEVKKKLKTPEFKALLTPGLVRLGELYKKSGKDLRIVGGAVRDLILGKKPKDIDLATDATPAQSISILMNEDIKIIQKWFDVFSDSPSELQDAIEMLGTRSGIHIVPTGLQHGTLTAIVNGEEYEITTLRIDTEHTGRHATVEFTKDWKQDAERRDLTFNAMSLELDGTLYDYFGGLEDLQASKAKFVGTADERIQEDYLRILRYFRFQGRTAKPDWDKETLEAIGRNAKGLEQISGERIWMELSKILSGNHTVEILKKMQDTGVDLYIGLPTFHDEKLLDRVKKHTENPATILASFIANTTDVDTLMSRWKFSAPEHDLMKFIVAAKRGSFDSAVAKKMWTSPKIKNEYVLELAAYFGREDIINELKAWKAPVFPVTGKDLQALGMEPGPEFGKVLSALEAKWKESDYQLSKEELLKLLK